MLDSDSKNKLKRKKVKRYVLKYVLIIFVIVGILNYDILEYGLRLGKGQLKILIKSKKVEKYLNDPEYPDSLKQKILLIQDIKKFTVDELGFQPSKNYNKLYDQKGKPMMFVVTGCKKYSLEPKIWKFPIVGKVTYKGFFTKAEAEDEAAFIEKQGYETRIRIVNAWSTLGWFRDPIMSSLLEEPPGDIAEVIIHELSHGTIFIKNNVDLSENLANFIGEKGAELYLIDRYGDTSKEYTEYIEMAIDYKKFTSHFIDGAHKLDSVYNSVEFVESPDSLKDIYKEQFISKIVSTMDTISFYNPQFFRNRYKKKLPNNANLIVFRQYNSMQDEFEAEFMDQGKGDLKTYVEFLIQKYN